MKKEVILVPKDKCVLDILAEMGERTRNAWIFLHKNVVKKLKKTANGEYSTATCLTLLWKATDEFPETTICIESGKIWSLVAVIKADDIAFEEKVDDPEDIIFFQMAA